MDFVKEFDNASHSRYLHVKQNKVQNRNRKAPGHPKVLSKVRQQLNQKRKRISQKQQAEKNLKAPRPPQKK